MNTQQILQFLDKPYINGANVCKLACIDPIRWQNVKRGYCLAFTEPELSNFRTIMFELQYIVSEATMKRIISKPSILQLKPMIKMDCMMEINYDRILRWANGTSELYIEEKAILNKVFNLITEDILIIRTKI